MVGLERSGTNLMQMLMNNCGVPLCHPPGDTNMGATWKHFRLIVPDGDGRNRSFCDPLLARYLHPPTIVAFDGRRRAFRARIETLDALDALIRVDTESKVRVEAARKAAAEAEPSKQHAENREGRYDEDLDERMRRDRPGRALRTSNSRPAQPWLSEAAPTQQYVVMLRAPSQWAASFAKYRRRETHAFDPKDPRLRQAYGCDWGLQIQAWLRIARCAQCSREGTAPLGNHPRIALVRYNADLLSNPKQTLRQVALRLGLNATCLAGRGEALRSGEYDLRVSQSRFAKYSQLLATEGGATDGSGTNFTVEQIKELEGAVDQVDPGLWARVGISRFFPEKSAAL